MWQHAILGILQVWNFLKLHQEDSTDPSQIWSAKSQDLTDAKLRSFCVFVEQRCRGFASKLHVSPPNRKQLPVCTHPAVAAQLVAMVDAFLLGQWEALPPLVEVAQTRVDLAIVHSTWGRKEWMFNISSSICILKYHLETWQLSADSEMVGI